MKAAEALGHARDRLAASNIENASLESELLLRHALDVSRTRLYLELNQELDHPSETIFRELVERRLNHEPAAYITRHREFYGLDFSVNRDVLIPRPESELLVEKTLDLARDHHLATIADIGTGCGAIAISLALNLPETRVYATDVSAAALKVARRNCRKHGVINRIHLLAGDLVTPLPEPVDLMVANLPYVKQSEIDAGGFEPPLALSGGRDGLQKIHRLCRQSSAKLRPHGYLLLEIGQGQKEAVTTLLHHLFPGAEIETSPDLGGIERVVTLHNSPI
ncbi:peptide chain release factor N(5)-glutamine methyltransferase [Chloroflexota bacterium]